MIEILKDNHFKTEKLLVTSDINRIIEAIQGVKRDELDFDIDGMVIKVNDVKLREKLGFTDKFPRWAIAYKFEAEETTTMLKDVKWQGEPVNLRRSLYWSLSSFAAQQSKKLRLTITAI